MSANANVLPESVEFVVCIEDNNLEHYRMVPVDGNVQGALVELLARTRHTLRAAEGDWEEYEPAQKYGSEERLRMTLAAQEMGKVRELFESENIPIDSHALQQPEKIVFYVAVFRYPGEKILGVKRATQFKGLFKARNRLVRIVNDTLILVEDSVFKLDNDFDYIVDRDQVLILRPSGFEFTANIDVQLAEGARRRTAELGARLPGIDFDSMADFVSTHKRAARLVASLASRDDTDSINTRLVKRLGRQNGVQLRVRNGKVAPAEGFEIAFLELLDRRRYAVELCEGREELYGSANRRLLGTR
jgi:Domain of unknown function (DUF4868)